MSTNAYERKMHALLHNWNEGVRSVPELARAQSHQSQLYDITLKSLKKLV